MPHLTALALVLLVAACGAAGSRSESGGEPQRPDGGGGAGDDGASEPPDEILTCLPTCATAADCELGGPLFDGDNYACERGVCVYLGCQSTEECALAYNGNLTCANSPGSSVRMCLNNCTSPADCAQPSTVYDEDNWDCAAGVCQYTGCTGDAECALYGDQGCHAFAGWSYPSCVDRCETAADCRQLEGGGLYDDDNFACDDGFCRYTGCTGDAECEAAIGGDVACAALGG